MTEKRNPFEMFKNIPHFDENFLKDFAGMDWQDPTGFLESLGRPKWPPVDLLETGNELIVLVEIPGLQKAGDVKVEIKNDTLKIEGEIPPGPLTSQTVKTHQQERHRGKFSRGITLPASVNSKSARATYNQGILEIRFIKIPGNQVETLTIDFV